MCITFDGDLVDMVRCSHIIETIEREELLSNVIEREAQLRMGLLDIRKIKNVRSSGVLFGFDLKDRDERGYIC